jgi:hypothetical protein
MNKIQELNDKARNWQTSESNVQYLFTSMVDELPVENKLELLHLISDFNDFDEDNDPYGEHDFVSVEYNGETYFFKIDYYDLDMEHGSEDPADDSKTMRVCTLMHSSEY